MDSIGSGKGGNEICPATVMSVPSSPSADTSTADVRMRLKPIEKDVPLI
jgi:hypothetical protein